MGKGLTISLSLITLLLGVVIGIELTLWYPLDSNKVSDLSTQSTFTTQFEEIDMLPAVRLPSLRLYREISGRPLFVTDRRPLNTNRLGKYGADFPKGLVLQGIYSTADKRIAVLFDKQKNKKIYLSYNQQISSWRVVKITPSEIMLVKGPYQKILRLENIKESDAREGSE